MTTDTYIERVNRQLKDLREQLTTCSGDECRKIDEAIAHFKTAETNLAGLDSRFDAFADLATTKLSASLDDKMAVWETRLKELETAVSTVARNVDPKTVVNPDSYLVCEDEACNTPLILGQRECPGCGSDVDWNAALTPYLNPPAKPKTATKEA